MVQHINRLLTPFQHVITPVRRQRPDIPPYGAEETTPVEMDLTVIITDIKQLAEPNATSRMVSHIEEILHG